MALSEARAPATAGAAAGELRQETLSERDIDAGLALSDAAGWNQTGDDWSLFIRHGRAIGLRDAGGRWVATAAALPYGSDRGWISMVLVAEAWRHRGLASRLLDDCVAHLRTGGIVPVLDATPAGAAVYRRLGFVPGFDIDRWERPASATGDAAIGPCRRALDRRHVARPASPTSTPSSPSTVPRPGSIAASSSPASCRGPRPGPGRPPTVAASSSLEPVGARPRSVLSWRATSAQAAALLDIAVAAAAGNAGQAIFLDLPRAHRPLADRLERQGFARQRPFVRMSLGATEAPQLGTGLFVLAGPEFG